MEEIDKETAEMAEHRGSDHRGRRLDADVSGELIARRNAAQARESAAVSALKDAEDALLKCQRAALERTVREARPATGTREKAPLEQEDLSDRTSVWTPAPDDKGVLIDQWGRPIPSPFRPR